MRIDGRRRNATQRSRQSFCQDYRANPSPRLSCIATLPHAASEQSQFNRKVDLLCNMKTWGHKSLKAQSSIRLKHSFHSRASHMHREYVKETSHPSREWIRVLWRTKLFNMWVANWYTRPALGQVFISAINLLAACYTSVSERVWKSERETKKDREWLRQRDRGKLD